MIDDYRFTSLFARAVSEWPQTISAKTLERYDNGSHTVVGLYELFESVTEKYQGADDEVIMDGLHISIYSVLLESAVYQVSLRPSELRYSKVKEKFDVRLRRSLASTDLRWTEADRDLARNYFRANERTDIVAEVSVE